MTADNFIPPAFDEFDGFIEAADVRPSRLGAVGDSSLANGIVSVASVALVGGSPRLAAKAAYAVVQDSFAERAAARRFARRRRSWRAREPTRR